MARQIIAIIAMVLFLAVIGLVGWQSISHRDVKISETEGNSVSLVRPAFAQTGSFLDQEAGIAAYVQVPSPVNLENVKGAFKTIEQETSEFVVGTVEITNAPLAPHAFVSSDGWVVAYFLRDESVGYAWPYYQGFKPPDDVLARALTQVGAIVGAPPSPLSYFDFAYPGANKISVINAPTYSDLLEVQIPNGFQVFEAAETGSWSEGAAAGIGVENVTPSIQIGQFQEWHGAFIVVYRDQPSARILARNADSLWHSLLGRPDFTSSSEATPTPVPTVTPQPSPTPEEPTPPEFTLLGDAMLQGDGLRLHPAEYSESGAAWFVAKQQVEDGFSMSFAMRITQVTPGRGGDGLAFVVQNVNDIALGVNGAGMGYEGIGNSLAVEFDTYQNSAAEFEGSVADPNDNHVSVQSRGGWWQNNADPQYSLGAATDIPDLADGAWHTVEIDYAPGTLTVWLDGAAVLTVAIELADYVILDGDGSAYIGFTGATGDWPQIPDVRNLVFTPTP